MTDRDTFAAAALTGLLASNPYDQAMTYEQYANESYRMADAMIRERGVTEPMPKETRAEVCFALTDAEREAVEYVELTLRCERHPVCERHTATLRGLLERNTVDEQHRQKGF